MSGKPKGPADPGAEREELRQLAREMHEAAQDARAAARELQAARAGLAADVRDTVDAALAGRYNEVLHDLETSFNNGVESISRRIDFHEDHIAECAKICIEKITEVANGTEARLLGYADAAQVQAVITEAIGAAVRDLAAEQAFVADVARSVQPRLKFVVT